MDERKRVRIEIDKNKETRTKEISKMIDEGGLGADEYYNVVKKASSEKENQSRDKNTTKNSKQRK